MARMRFLDKAEELDVMIEAERARLKKVQPPINLREVCSLPPTLVEHILLHA